MGKLKIHTSANIAVIDKVDKNQVRNFAEFVRNKIESKSESQNTSSSTVVESDIFDKLEKLGKLKDSGVLSEEEFNDQKTKLLGKI